MNEAHNSSAAPVAVAAPAVFVPHGGGPWPFVDAGVMSHGPGMDELRAYLSALGETVVPPPKAVLCISAHWEESVPTLMDASRPPMLYDYGGFPPEAYTIEWPAPGAPDLAAEVQSILSEAGFDIGRDSRRGFDHGTFVPLKLAYPQASMPTLQLSLVRGLDPAVHLAMGKALAPLRAHGVYIIGSGMSYHNLGSWRYAMGGAGSPGARKVVDDSRRFDDWLNETMALEPDARETRLVEWADAPGARECHPREEHLIPLMVVAGAALEGAARIPYRGRVMSAHVSAVEFA